MESPGAWNKLTTKKKKKKEAYYMSRVAQFAPLPMVTSHPTSA
jgi:hypothetical protein